MIKLGRAPQRRRADLSVPGRRTHLGSYGALRLVGI
jgi:hypothetical protein